MQTNLDVSKSDVVHKSPSPTSPMSQDERYETLFRENVFNTLSIFLLGGLFVGLLWFMASKGMSTNHITAPLSLAVAGVGSAIWLVFFIQSVKETSQHYLHTK